MGSYFEIRDKYGRVRFQALRQIDAEFYAKYLIADKGEEKPDIFELPHEARR